MPATACFFQRSAAGEDFVAGGYVVGRAVGRPVVPFGMPARNSQGQISGVAFVSIDLAEMAKIVAANPLPMGSRVLITDRDGLVLAANPPEPQLLGKPVPGAVLQAAVKDRRTGIAEGSDASGAGRIYAFMPAGSAESSPFYVALSADRKAVTAPVWKTFRLEVLMLTLVALVGGAFARALGRPMFVRPTDEILQATQRMQAGDSARACPSRAPASSANSPVSPTGSTAWPKRCSSMKARFRPS